MSYTMSCGGSHLGFMIDTKIAHFVKKNYLRIIHTKFNIIQTPAIYHRKSCEWNKRLRLFQCTNERAAQNWSGMSFTVFNSTLPDMQK